jgi:hypothetical protein
VAPKSDRSARVFEFPEFLSSCGNAPVPTTHKSLTNQLISPLYRWGGWGWVPWGDMLCGCVARVGYVALPGAWCWCRVPSAECWCWCLVPGAWCRVPSAECWCWCLVPGAECRVPSAGAWCLVPGAWCRCLVPGAWCLVPGAWCYLPCRGDGRTVSGVVVPVLCGCDSAMSRESTSIGGDTGTDDWYSRAIASNSSSLTSRHASREAWTLTLTDEAPGGIATYPAIFRTIPAALTFAVALASSSSSTLTRYATAFTEPNERWLKTVSAIYCS